MECLEINKFSRSYLDYADIIFDKYLNVLFQEKPASIQLENFVKFTKKILKRSPEHPTFKNLAHFPRADYTWTLEEETGSVLSKKVFYKKFVIFRGIYLKKICDSTVVSFGSMCFVKISLIFYQSPYLRNILTRS